MKLLLLVVFTLCPVLSGLAEEDNGNRGLTDWDRKRLLMDLRREKVISSVRKGESMTDKQILELHAQMKTEQRLKAIEKAVK